MFTLIENGDVHVPELMAQCSALLANDNFVKIGDASVEDVRAPGVGNDTVDASGRYVTLGLISTYK